MFSPLDFKKEENTNERHDIATAYPQRKQETPSQLAWILQEPSWDGSISKKKLLKDTRHGIWKENEATDIFANGLPTRQE